MLNTFQCHLFLKTSKKRLLWNSPPWSTHISFDFLPFEIISRNALTILIPLLPFKWTTYVYLLKKSISHNKYLISLLYLLNDCISAKSTPQILSLQDEQTFHLLNFQIICLWSSFASWWFGSESTPLLLYFISKNL